MKTRFSWLALILTSVIAAVAVSLIAIPVWGREEASYAVGWGALYGLIMYLTVRNTNSVREFNCDGDDGDSCEPFGVASSCILYPFIILGVVVRFLRGAKETFSGGRNGES